MTAVDVTRPIVPFGEEPGLFDLTGLVTWIYTTDAGKAWLNQFRRLEQQSAEAEFYYRRSVERAAAKDEPADDYPF